MNCKLTLQEKSKDLRTEQGLSLLELSEKTGISKSALGSYESDDTKNAITMNAIVTLAEFYGVTSDYLLGITENRECHPFPVDELGLDDDTIDLLKERNLNVRLICEMIKDPHFPDFLSDLEIYVDNLASAQIRNMNKYIEHNRAMIKDKYALSDSDHYMRSLKAALINEDNYFDNLLGNDISAIAKNLRELHKKDSNTGSDNTVFDEFMDTCEEVQKADADIQQTFSNEFYENGSLRIQDLYGYCGTIFHSLQIRQRKRTWQKEEKIAACHNVDSRPRLHKA